MIGTASDISWWVLVPVLIVVVAVLVWFFRSTRRWQQQPPGNHPDASKAEQFLDSTAKNNGYNLF